MTRRKKDSSQKKSSPRPKQPRVPASTTVDDGYIDPVMTLVRIGIGSLLVIRFLITTEAPEEGATLWIAQLWLGLIVLWAVARMRDQRFDIRFGWIDVAVWLVILGHVASGLNVVLAEGNKRAAVNLIWEWLAVGAAFFLMRQEFNLADRKRIAVLVLGIGASLSGLGLAQHYVLLPESADEFIQHLDEFDKLQTRIQSGHGTAMDRRRYDFLAQQFASAGLPVTGPGRARAIDRIKFSREPIAFFALANTLGGVLAVSLFLSVDWSNNETGKRKLLAFGVCVLVAYCLILTKSRTAWVGIAAGGLWWFWRHQAAANQREDSGSEFNTDAADEALSSAGTIRSVRRIWLVVGVLLVGGFAIAALSGGFDHRVMTEAPKSLQYRLGYWKGSWRSIQQSPLMGLGLGNFRQQYLPHKLPESSEEIADPHNLVLDAWANGGLLAIAGLVLVCVLLVRRSLNQSRLHGASNNTSVEEPGRAILMGTVLGPLLLMSFSFAIGASTDLRVIAVAAALCSLVLLRPNVNSTAAIGAAGVGLIVHLCGAGGFGMPTVQLLAVAMIAAAIAGEGTSWTIPGFTFPVGTGVAVAICGVCFATAVRPMLIVTSLESHAMAELSAGRFDRAQMLLDQAAQADPFSPRPLFQLADATFRHWTASPRARDREFNNAIDLAEMAMRRDPYSAWMPRRVGQWFLIRSRSLKESERIDKLNAASKAAELLRRSLERHPTHVATHADLAEACALSGDKAGARVQAVEALELDSINREQGHTDKFLSSEVLDRLRSLTGDELKNPNN